MRGIKVSAPAARAHAAPTGSGRDRVYRIYRPYICLHAAVTWKMQVFSYLDEDFLISWWLFDASFQYPNPVAHLVLLSQRLQQLAPQLRLAHLPLGFGQKTVGRNGGHDRRHGRQRRLHRLVRVDRGVRGQAEGAPLPRSVDGRHLLLEAVLPELRQPAARLSVLLWQVRPLRSANRVRLLRLHHRRLQSHLGRVVVRHGRRQRRRRHTQVTLLGLHPDTNF